MDAGRRNFHAVWPSLFATSLGLTAYLPVLAFYVQERFGIDDPEELAFWVGAVYGIAPLCAAVIGPVWGGLGDRIGKKPMAIRANLAIAAATALMPLAPTPLVLMLMRALQGVLAGYVAPAMALAAEDAPRGEHGVLIARLQVAIATGAFLGPLVGAQVTSWTGDRAALFWLTSLLSAGSGVWLHLRAVGAKPPRDPAPFLPGFVRAARELLANRVFAWLLLLVWLLRLGQYMLEPYVALFLGDLGPQRLLLAFYGEPVEALDATVAVAFGVQALAQVLFAPRWGRLADRFGPLRCLAALGIVVAPLLAATAWVATVDQFLVLRAAAAVFMAGSMGLAYAAASKRVDDRHRTLAFSLVQSCMQLGFAFGPMVGGWVAVTAATAAAPLNYRCAYVAAGALCLVAGIGLLALRRVSTRRGAAL